MLRFLSPLLCFVSLMSAPSFSQDMRPESLATASRQVVDAVESGRVAGAVHLVQARGHRVHLLETGVRDIETQQPLQADTLVRIYSMSKPITSVAAMTLYEQGKFQLDDPVSKYIAAFEHATVWSQEQQEAIAPKRPLTIRDVFRHTTGYAYGGNGNPHLEQEYVKRGLKYRPPAGMLPPDMTIEDAAHALAEIPAHHHPGERFTYGYSTDLLGRLIEVWSGQPLNQYLTTAIFEPLDMHDTGFRVPEGKRERFAACHTTVDGQLAIVDKAATSPYLDGFTFLSGGGGLVSTANDYAKFCEMLIHSGERRGVRVLKPETLQLMFTDQLDGVAGGFRFGLGFAIGDVALGQEDSQRTFEQYSWGGYASTDFRVIPDAQLFQVFIRQHVPSQHQLANQVFKTISTGVQIDATAELSSVEPVWPGWLGPQRNGHVPEAAFQQLAESELELSWRVEVGEGYGTPLVVGDRLYQHARVGEDEVVWCLNRNTGEVLWQKSVPTPFQIGGGAEKHGKGPKSNPYYADGIVFTLGMTGLLTAWDASTGEQLWQRDERETFTPNQPYWGCSTSPIVDDGKLFVHLGNDETGALTAVDIRNGETLWTHGEDGTSYSSPLVVDVQGIRQVIEWNHRTLVGVNAETGAFLWEFPFPHVGTDQNMPTPVWFNGRVLLGGENRGLLSLKPEQSETGNWSVIKEWHQQDVALDMSTPVISNGLLFGMSHYKRGQLFCLDPQTGQVLWTGPGRTGENVTFLSGAGFVLALINTGELRLIAATPDEYQPLRSWQVAESPTWAAPVLLNDSLLIKDKKTLSRWTFRSPEDSN